jgi:NAD(P)-dependent dehydrogenase (short-subunit alcohol dehydrogenase family)
VRFDNRVAIVTGAARGIGLAITERLAQEGARVVLVDLLEDLGGQAERYLRDKGLAAIFVRADITSRADVAGLVDLAVQQFGRVHVLVNNAALVKETPFFEATEQDVARILSVNIGGTLLVSQLVARHMVQAGGGGAIVNMSSITAAQGAPDLVAYAASKGGISSLTRSMAIALADHDIRVNAVAPGAIGTESFREFYDSDPAFRRRILSRTPLRRLGTPEQAAAVVAFLASEDAAYITGQVVYPDGGRLALSYTVPTGERP